ncbi:MAG: OmpH family outer membrane protein [Saprospiraceae bacterium]|jgi:outer membrane protein|nr:OmpH family outer membrane protein [Saprospiraceae bacterium]
MKILPFVALVLMGLTTLVSCKKEEKAAALPTAGEVTTVGGVKIVYVNIDSLLEGYDLYQEQKKSLETQSSNAEKSIASKIEAFQKRLAKFQRDVYETQQKAQNIPPIELKALEQKFAAQQNNLATEEQSLMKQRDEAAQALDKSLNDLQAKLKSNIDNYLAKVAAEKGYDYVLIKGSAGGVLFGKDELDITKAAIAAMNEEHTASKK